MRNEIHGTAVVDPGARIGEDVRIGPFAVIEDGVSIGDGCVIGPHVTVLKHTTIGAKCKIHAGAVLGDLPQDLAFGGAESFVRIGSNCVIREGVTIHRGTKPGTETVIGDDCFLMAYSHYAHNVRVGNKVIVANGALIAGYVDVGEKVFISGNCLVHQFVRIGRNAMLGGGSGVSKDVPPFCTTTSGGVNVVSGLNTIGLRRAGFDAQDRAGLKQAFKTVYLGGLNVTQALQALDSGSPGPLVVEFADFIRHSKRGICAYSGSGTDSGSDSQG